MTVDTYFKRVELLQNRIDNAKRELDKLQVEFNNQINSEREKRISAEVCLYPNIS
jgi:hypothetical protein